MGKEPLTIYRVNIYIDKSIIDLWNMVGDQQASIITTFSDIPFFKQLNESDAPVRDGDEFLVWEKHFQLIMLCNLRNDLKK